MFLYMIFKEVIYIFSTLIRFIIITLTRKERRLEEYFESSHTVLYEVALNSSLYKVLIQNEQYNIYISAEQRLEILITFKHKIFFRLIAISHIIMHNIKL